MEVVVLSITYHPSGQNYQKNSLKKCVFVNSALQNSKIQCHAVKNILATDCFFGDFAHWVKIK